VKRAAFLFSLFLILSLPLLTGAGRRPSDYDTEPPEEETPEKAPKSAVTAVEGVASGVKQVAYDGPKGFVEETAVEVPKKPTVTRFVEGVNEGTRKLLDSTVKGTYRVATLGTSELESYEIEEPEKGSGEPTKIKISLPGT
jgi:hypothetical protein